MKILAIRGKNLASLAGAFEIDFTAEPLKSAGIFAITGSTGSGKSTLLDTLCLALFDNTPRTNHASENNIQVVDVNQKTINQKDSRTILRKGTSDGYAEVDFRSLGGETFRSHWSVRRSRDKVEGSLQATDFRLTNLSTNTEEQGRKTELLAKVVELIGLTFDQFTRAVLLAQGDFATFLKATQKEKAELLEKLTGTEIYSRISASIYEQSKTAEQELHILQERIQNIELLTDEQLTAFATEKQELQTSTEELNKTIATRNNQIQWITEFDALTATIKQAEASTKEIEATLEAAQPRYQHMKQIDRVQEIRDTYNELKHASKQQSDDNAKLNKLQSEQNANTLLIQQANTQLQAHKTTLEQHTQAYAVIEPQVKQARIVDIRLVDAQNNATTTDKEQQQAASNLTKIEQTILVTQQSIAEANQTADKLTQWFSKCNNYASIVTRIDLITNLLEDISAAQKQLVQSQTTEENAQKALEATHTQLAILTQESERLNKILPTELITLRAQLAEQTPCPVCGSLDHPFQNIITESLEEKALEKEKSANREQLERITKLSESYKNEIIRVKALIESYTQTSNDALLKLDTYLTPIPQWKTEFKQGNLTERLNKFANEWNTNTLTLTEVKQKVSNLNTSLTAAHSNQEEAKITLATQTAKQQETTRIYNNLKQERALLLQGEAADSVENKYIKQRDTLSVLINNSTEQWQKATDQQATFSGAINQLTVSINKLDTDCKELNNHITQWIDTQTEPITYEQLTQRLSKDTQWLATERKALSDIREQQTALAATLQERTSNLQKHLTAVVKPADEVSKQTLKQQVEEYQTTLKDKGDRIAYINLSITTHTKGKERIKTFEDELKAKQTLSENWKKLNDLLGSADGGKFKILAQGYTLEALLSYANKHLLELSKRYQLQRIPNTLALQVVDLDMLGDIRTVHSLSGGESFLISLALALGLSSLSSNRMKVESLFIDEGFGSLDIDTLRIAMDALERLQSQGRKIGVISHVAEMTERITTQIKVVKTVNGRSQIEIV
jgi:exonuclease SbcC